MAHKRYNSAYYKRVRAEVLQRDYFTCHYCGQIANTADHLIPISKGGTDQAENMVACCTQCNSGKRDRMTPTFFERNGTRLLVNHPSARTNDLAREL